MSPLTEEPTELLETAQALLVAAQATPLAYTARTNLLLEAQVHVSLAQAHLDLAALRRTSQKRTRPGLQTAPTPKENPA